VHLRYAEQSTRSQAEQVFCSNQQYLIMKIIFIQLLFSYTFML